MSVSLWMLAHLTFRDAALHGNGSSGYVTLANIFFRPVLMLIGLFLGYVVCGPGLADLPDLPWSPPDPTS